jgi:stage II sporulation protein AB (anti-sigma F factor)
MECRCRETELEEIQYRSEKGTVMEQFNMEFESHSDNEEFARVVAAVFISRLNPTLEEINDVKTAVSEAVTNAEIHGYGGGEGIIRMQIRIEDRTATIRIQDQGIGIPDIRRAMEPLYTTDRSGERSGMGFSFMEAFMDEVQVESEPGSGTIVTLKKTIGR